MGSRNEIKLPGRIPEAFYVIIMHMLKIYILDASPLKNGELFNSIYETMTPYRKTRIDRLKPAASKRESLGAGYLLSRALSELGCSYLLDALKDGPNGKPYFDCSLLPSGKSDDIFFNLSHSGEMVMCAIAHKPVGCDIQKMDKDVFKIARRCYAEGEKNYVLGKYAADEFEDADLRDIIPELEIKGINDRFYRIWVMKEAYTKLSGEGIQRDFRSFDVLDVPGHFLEYKLNDHRLAVCMDENDDIAAFDKPEIVTIKGIN